MYKDEINSISQQEWTQVSSRAAGRFTFQLMVFGDDLA
jgi:hypothetical protein